MEVGIAKTLCSSCWLVTSFPETEKAGGILMAPKHLYIWSTKLFNLYHKCLFFLRIIHAYIWNHQTNCILNKENPGKYKIDFVNYLNYKGNKDIKTNKALCEKVIAYEPNSYLCHHWEEELQYNVCTISVLDKLWINCD